MSLASKFFNFLERFDDRIGCVYGKTVTEMNP